MNKDVGCDIDCRNANNCDGAMECCQCGKSFCALDAVVDDDLVFCSDDCRDEYRAELFEGDE